MDPENSKYSARFRELQEKFRSLEPGIEDSETKKALSVMSGMIQEVWRHVSNSDRSKEAGGFSMNDVADLYRNAPAMNGSAINKPLEPGTKAPDFSLQDADGKMVSLSHFKGAPLMLVFYPLDWSPGCSQQLDLYQHELEEFEKRGVAVAGISIDSIYSHGAWSAVRKIKFPLLSDFNPKGAISKKYSVYRETDGFSERAIYIIDRRGVIRYSYVSPFLHHIPDIYQLFQHIDTTLTDVKV